MIKHRRWTLRSSRHRISQRFQCHQTLKRCLSQHLRRELHRPHLTHRKRSSMQSAEDGKRQRDREHRSHEWSWLKLLLVRAALACSVLRLDGRRTQERRPRIARLVLVKLESRVRGSARRVAGSSHALCSTNGQSSCSHPISSNVQPMMTFSSSSISLP